MNKNQYLKVSLMLFSMFFGAGNFIFPPIVGKMAGTSMWITLTFFSITAVLLPVLGVLAVSETKGLQNLAKRVDKKFAGIFTILIYLSIGPMLGIPRAGALPFEISVAPFLSPTVDQQIALFVYTLVFFGITYLLAMNPGKVLENLGKFLTPALLLLIFGLFASTLLTDLPAYTAPVAEYKTVPMLQGFVNGYNTMDAIAALNFGFIVYLSIKGFGISDEREISKATKICGITAGALLVVIYFALAHLGAKSALLFPATENGAEILNLMSQYMLGSNGALLIGAIFLLACLTTCVGLVASCATYFTELFNNKFSYRTWVIIWTLSSMLLANFGLNRILEYSVTILNVIYPISIVLVLMAILNKKFSSNRFIYRSVVYITTVVSIFSVLSMHFNGLESFIKILPFAQYQMGWVIPAVVIFLLTTAWFKLVDKEYDIEIFPSSEQDYEL